MELAIECRDDKYVEGKRKSLIFMALNKTVMELVVNGARRNFLNERITTLKHE